MCHCRATFQSVDCCFRESVLWNVLVAAQ